MRIGRALLAVLVVTVVGGCDRFHNPKDVAKITDLQKQLDEAKAQETISETRAVHAEQLLSDNQAAYKQRIADAAERQADAAEDQALTADLDRIDRQ